MPIGRKRREEEEKFLTRSLVTCKQRGDERADIFSTEQTTANEDDRCSSACLIKSKARQGWANRGKVARDVKHTCASKVRHE